MRHLTRLYFDNSPEATASDKYVALIDQGTDSSGTPRLYEVTGFLLTAKDGVRALDALLRTHCFFKLPVGSAAIVDVYIPDGFNSDEPKTFDYQVFKSKNSNASSDGRAQGIAAFLATLKESNDQQSQRSGGTSGEPAGPGQSAGDESPSGPSGPTGESFCLYYPSGPGCCGDQTKVRCPDGTNPGDAVAVCNETDNILECLAPEPPGPS
jgi:hypothetical protein